MDNLLQPKDKANKPGAANPTQGYDDADMALLADKSSLSDHGESESTPSSHQSADMALLEDKSSLAEPGESSDADATSLDMALLADKSSLPAVAGSEDGGHTSPRHSILPYETGEVAAFSLADLAQAKHAGNAQLPELSPEDAALLAGKKGVCETPVHPETEPSMDQKMISASATVSPGDFGKWAEMLWQQYFATEARTLTEQRVRQYQNGEGATAISGAVEPVAEKLSVLQQRLEPLEKLSQSLAEMQNFCQELAQQFKGLPNQMTETVQQEFSRFWQKEEARFQATLQERLANLEGQIKDGAAQSGRITQEEWTSFWQQEERRMQDSFQERFARADTQLAQLASQIGKLEQSLQEFDNRSQVKELIHKENTVLWQQEEKKSKQREEQGKVEIQQLHSKADKIESTLRREFEKLSQYLQILQNREAQQKQQVKEMEETVQQKLKGMEKVYADLQKKSEAMVAAKVSRPAFAWAVALLFIGYLALLVLLLVKQ
jgi:DNA repair exonuclease SbcCD ATPase subunit